jgi:zinc protease
MRRTNSSHLKEKLKYLNKAVSKRIYLSGPATVLEIKRVLQEECGWGDQAGLYEREVNYDHEVVKQSGPEIFLVPVKDANQAQVRIGRFIPKDEISSHELMGLASDYLGGGFTAPLMRELRVMRGLTYSVSAYAGPQKYYGRSGIATFTKNETLGKLLKVTKEVLEKNQRGEFSAEQFDRAVEGLAGRYPFGFEDPMSYMTQLMYLDHEGRDLKELYNFQESVRSLTKEQLVKELKSLYGWSKMSIVVVGDRSLEEQLKQFGKVKIVKAEKVL